MIQIKSTLLGADAPRVLTVPMIASVLAVRRSVPARNTIYKWIREQVSNGALRPDSRAGELEDRMDLRRSLPPGDCRKGPP